MPGRVISGQPPGLRRRPADPPNGPVVCRAHHRETERILVAAARVGQHVFAQQVLANYGGQCVFCGLPLPWTARGTV
jgi:hypothetical protein